MRPWCAAALAVAALTLGCREEAGECNQDGDCLNAAGCVGRVCVARLGAASVSVALEIDPRTEGPSARLDLPRVTFTAMPAVLGLDDRATMRATLVSAQTAPLDRQSALRVVLALPSLLPGRPELTFVSGGVNPVGVPAFDVAVDVPASLLGRTGRLSLMPVRPLDRVFAPWVVELPVAATTQAVFAAESETVLIEGRVSSSAVPGGNEPRHEVRLFVGARVVSNVSLTEAGAFQLRAQRSAVFTGSAPDATVRPDARIEVTPADPSAVPVALSLKYDGAATVGSLRMPPAPPPLPFIIPVNDADSKAPVPGAIVRFSTRVEGALPGEARYVRLAQTAGDGNVMIPLLPGTGLATRDYTVSVIPPEDAEVGALCLNGYAVGAPVAGTPVRVGAAVLLPKKAVLEGEVRREGGSPAAGMAVRAVRLSATVPVGCDANPTAAPGDALTDRDGRYRLRLDAGTYRVELTPPVGSGLPHHAVAATAVAGATRLDVVLPPAVLVEGQVVARGTSMGTRAEVRAYNAGAGAMASPGPLGTALTDPDGRFRLVLPRTTLDAAP